MSIPATVIRLNVEEQLSTLWGHYFEWGPRTPSEAVEAINQTETNRKVKERKKVMGTKPTFEQAQLHLQVYDQRREARLRQARDWFQQNYKAETFDDSMRLAPPGTENGTFVGMVIGYWEQACALLNYGLL